MLKLEASKALRMQCVVLTPPLSLHSLEVKLSPSVLWQAQVVCGKPNAFVWSLL